MRVVRGDAAGGVEAAIEVLRSGGVVAFPTETFYGLAADPRNRSAVAAVLAAKGRTEAATLPLVIASLEALVDLFPEPSGEALRLARAFWPGPLTLVLRGPGGLDRAVVSARGTVAVRVPGSSLARRLLAGFGGPLTSTSANRTGRPPARLPGDLEPELAAHVALLLDGGPAPGGAPSTIVDLTTTPAALLRSGAVPPEEVERVLGGSLRRRF